MNTLNETAQGVYLITVTPFKDNGELDLPSTDRMVDFCLERGVTGLTVLGIMGEATKLTAEESRLFVRQVLARVQGKVPVVVGDGAGGAEGVSQAHGRPPGQEGRLNTSGMPPLNPGRISVVQKGLPH